MEINRETIEIETPNKHKVVLKSWLTGREKRGLKKPLMNRMKLDIEGKGVLEDAHLGELYEEMEDLTIKAVVVSVDGDTENVVEKVLNLKEEDYDFVLAEIDKIVKKEHFTKP